MGVEVIVLAHGPEPTLVACVTALRRSDVPVDVLVVDNEAAPGPIAEVAAMTGVRVLRPGRNLGFAGGCNEAVRRSTGEVLVVVNSDAIVASQAVGALVERVRDEGVALACASIRLADAPDTMNTAGNPVHFLMFSWVGGYGEPASRHDRPVDVASMTGVAFAVRRSVWDELGGFDPAYFAYCEDVYLSMRAWQAGYRVVFEPAAVVRHHYAFARNRAKGYLLERNRLMNLVLLPETRTLRLLAAPAAVVELGVLAVAVRDGWAGDKVAGWRWLAAHRRELAARRREVQAARRVPDHELVHLLRGPLDPPEGLGPGVPRMVSRALARYWSWAVGRL